MKENSCCYKIKYEGYLELICKCLLDDIYTELTCMKISYEKIICVYRKTRVMVA